MVLLFYAMAVLLFPAGAVWAWRRGGKRGLTRLTVIAVSLKVRLNSGEETKNGEYKA